MFEISKLDVPSLQGTDRWSFYAVRVVLLFLSCDHSFLVLLVSYDLFPSLLLYSGLMFPCRALSCGLPLASANAYRALGVVIVLSYVVSWFASCIG